MIPPEDIEKETKRLKMRYKIINEMMQTEQTFLQDMIVMEEEYNAFCYDCSLVSKRHQQTIFGRTKYVVAFSSTFYKDLSIAAGKYVDTEESLIVEAGYEQLLDWDAQTSIGEAFWSSVNVLRDNTEF